MYIGQTSLANALFFNVDQILGDGFQACAGLALGVSSEFPERLATPLPLKGEFSLMQDIIAHLEKLRADAAECQLISDRATDIAKKELFARLAQHHRTLALELERAIGSNMTG